MASRDLESSNDLNLGKNNNSLWYLLGLESSLSWRVSALFLLPGALSPIFIDRETYGGSIFFWIGLIALAHSSFTLTLLCSRLVIHRKNKNESRPIATLIAFVLAQAVRGSVLGYVIVAQGLTDDPQLSFRILSGGVFIATVLSVIAIGVAVYDQHTSLVSELENKSKYLTDLKILMDTRILVASNTLREFIRTVVEPRLEQIDKLLESLKSGGHTAAAVSSLKNYVDDELRPFSYEIAHSRELLKVEQSATRPVRHFALPKRLDISLSFRPGVTTLLFFITYGAATQRTMTPLEALPFNVVTTVLLLSIFHIFKRLTRNVKVKVATTFLIINLFFASVGPIILEIENYLGLNTPSHISRATIFVGLIFGTANVGYSILTAQRAQLITELNQTVDELTKVVALLQQREWIARRRVSYVMHGTLQSALNSAAIKLGSTSQPSSELIDTIRLGISKALDRIGYDNPRSYSFETAQEEITEIWDGAIDIKWDVQPEAKRIMTENPETSECVAEVVREAVSNASKHGSATKVEILVNIENNLISLRVTDNGPSINTGLTQGFGSELFDDVCLDWKLEPGVKVGMILNAEFAVKSLIQSKKSIGSTDF